MMFAINLISTNVDQDLPCCMAAGRQNELKLVKQHLAEIQTSDIFLLDIECFS